MVWEQGNDAMRGRGGAEGHCLHHVMLAATPQSFERAEQKRRGTREGGDRCQWQPAWPVTANATYLANPDGRTRCQISTGPSWGQGDSQRGGPDTKIWGKTGPFHLPSEAEKGNCKSEARPQRAQAGWGPRIRAAGGGAHAPGAPLFQAAPRPTVAGGSPRRNREGCGRVTPFSAWPPEECFHYPGSAERRSLFSPPARLSRQPALPLPAPGSPRPAPRSPPAAPPGRVRRGTLCKCNLSAGPASARKPRAPLPGTRGGALGAGRRPVHQRRLTENQTAQAAGRPRPLSLPAPPRPLAARSLFVPPDRPRVPPRPAASPSQPPSLLRFWHLLPLTSPPGPVCPALSPSRQIAPDSIPFLLESRKYKRSIHTIPRQPVQCEPQGASWYHPPHRVPGISGTSPPPDREILS